LVSTNPYTASDSGSSGVGTLRVVPFANVHPASQAATPDGSLASWVWVVVVLALVVMSGLVLASRR
jgi:hypothetical protein